MSDALRSLPDSTDVWCLGLPARTERALYNREIEKVGQLRNCDDRFLLGRYGIGPVGLRAIRERVPFDPDTYVPPPPASKAFKHRCQYVYGRMKAGRQYAAETAEIFDITEARVFEIVGRYKRFFEARS